MPRKLWNDGQEVIEGDLSEASKALELELYDRILYELMGRQQSLSFGDSLLCSYVNSVTSQVKLGNGVYYDNTQVDPEPMTRLLRLAANTNVTHAAADGSNNRIDIICVQAARANNTTVTRNFKDASSGVVSAQSMVVETDWASSLSVVTGTPAGSPAVPATPAGKLKLAEVLVTAVTGIGSASAYTDKRARYKAPNSWRGVVSKSATYTVDLDDEILICTSTFTATLPAAALCTGKRFTVVNAGTGVITIAGNGGELIIGLATATLDTQYTTMELVCNGTAWFIL